MDTLKADGLEGASQDPVIPNGEAPKIPAPNEPEKP
jgi:hypothetical protein